MKMKTARTRALCVVTCLICYSPLSALALSYVEQAEWYLWGTDILGVRLNAGWPTEDVPDVELPCYLQEQCYLSADATLGYFGVTPNRPSTQPNAVMYRNGERLSEIRKRWIAKNGVTARVDNPYKSVYDPDVSYEGKGDACFVYFPFTNGGNLTSGFPLPGTVCNVPAPPTVTCDSLPSMEYDFGTAIAGRTSGLRMTQRHTLSCTNATNVTLKLGMDLRLTGLLTAQMSVNGRPVDTNGATYRVTGPATPLDFVVTTSGIETAAGDYTASSVLLMEYN
ncbi:Uncharacterised protein [Serratia fonticola]|nr:Uncharacterised protein [Serratia fonticola]CAI1731848.1 Uncharacterised protein [Serratia fonticola]CAI1995486.1 Uncharacterised protein [Serratia fonticola]CAI2002729.1 Uncharacterised protein [Serratia fonticola]